MVVGLCSFPRPQDLIGQRLHFDKLPMNLSLLDFLAGWTKLASLDHYFNNMGPTICVHGPRLCI
jgi:hypothetical protein